MNDSKVQTRTMVQWIIMIVVMSIAVANPLFLYSTTNSTDNAWRLGLDLRGGVDMIYRAKFDETKDPAEFNTLDKRVNALQGAVEVVRKRIDPGGTMEILVTHNNVDRLVIQVPGIKEKAEKKGDLTIDSLTKLLGSTVQLQFIDTGSESFPEGTDISEQIKNGKYPVTFEGSELNKAEFRTDQVGQPIVGFEWKKEAGDRFGQYTSQNVGKYMAIVLDGKVISCPVIKGPIWGGSGVIEGKFSTEQVDLLVRQLNGGRLPVPLAKSSVRYVGPTLGKESLKASLIAGLVGFGMVVVYMLVWYKVAGLIASLALAMFVILNLGFISLFQITLTLPGIAGIILGVGMAVDSNVIIFERLKEELTWGKTMQAAIDTAFNRAWVAVFDSHVTLILTSILLYMYGEGPIKGFAVTLVLGGLISLYSAVTVTRVMIQSVTSSGIVTNRKLLV